MARGKLWAVACSWIGRSRQKNRSEVGGRGWGKGGRRQWEGEEDWEGGATRVISPTHKTPSTQNMLPGPRSISPTPPRPPPRNATSPAPRNILVLAPTILPTSPTHRPPSKNKRKYIFMPPESKRNGMSNLAPVCRWNDCVQEACCGRGREACCGRGRCCDQCGCRVPGRQAAGCGNAPQHEHAA